MKRFLCLLIGSFFVVNGYGQALSKKKSMHSKDTSSHTVNVVEKYDTMKSSPLGIQTGEEDEVPPP